jgi:hypothetical protein
MKNTIKFKKKLFFGAFSALLAIIAIIFVIPVADETLFPVLIENQTEPEPTLIPEPPATTVQLAPAKITPILAEESAVEEIIVMEELIAEIIENPLIPPHLTPPPQEPQTSPTLVNSQGRDVQGNGYSFYRGADGRLDFNWMVAPGGEVISYEEYGIRMKTNPPKPDEVHGTDEYGNLYKVVDGQKYVWHDILGWGEDNGMGTVTIMDAQSDGHRFFVEPCGTVNLSKIITPSGEIISYEEYQRRKGIVPVIIVEPLQLHVISDETQITMPIAEMQSEPINIFIEIDGEILTWEEYVVILE